MLFDQAKARLTELNRNRYAGYDDWRLPTLDEAMSLMTRPEDGIPYEMVAGSETKKAVYHLSGSFDVYGAPFIWTSDPASAGTVWVVYYADGICSPERSAMFNAYMRAVRSRR